MIRLVAVHKWFGPLHVLDDVSLGRARGRRRRGGRSEWERQDHAVSLHQPIGDDPIWGDLVVNGVSVHDPKTNVNKLLQDIGMVFQHFNLFPHLTALQNITLAPMKVKRLSRAEAESVAMELLHSRGDSREGAGLSDTALRRSAAARCYCPSSGPCVRGSCCLTSRRRLSTLR